MNEIENLIEKIRQCDSIHNNCDYLLEHDESYILVQYIEQLQEEKTNLVKYLEDKIDYLNNLIKGEKQKVKPYGDEKNYYWTTMVIYKEILEKVKSGKYE